MKVRLTIMLFFIFYAATSQQPAPPGLNGIPYRLTNAKDDKIKALVFFISGDGGYASFDQNICTEFAKLGYPVISKPWP